MESAATSKATAVNRRRAATMPAMKPNGRELEAAERNASGRSRRKTPAAIAARLITYNHGMKKAVAEVTMLDCS